MSHQARVDEEVQELCRDIARLGRRGDDGAHGVEFGALFDDEKVQQYYEALVGTLRAAKRAGLVDFKGQMLLKGAHDGVVIRLLETSEPTHVCICHESPSLLDAFLDQVLFRQP